MANAESAPALHSALRIPNSTFGSGFQISEMLEGSYILPPALPELHPQAQVDAAPEQRLDLGPRPFANPLQHLPARADDDSFLGFLLDVDRRLDIREVSPRA